MEMEIASKDSIRPNRIEHRCEDVYDRGQLIDSSNHLIYEFEIGSKLWRARAYLDDIQTVAVLGLFDRRGDGEMEIGGDIDPRIIDYLRRRFIHITQLTRDGFVSVE